MLEEYYTKISTYLLETFGSNVIYFIFVLTTLVAIIYFVAISYVITQMDRRYFVRKNITHKSCAESKSDNNQLDKLRFFKIGRSVNLMLEAFKIVMGVFLVLCGIAMLVLPGQGLITILIGLSLLPFPGKQKLEQNLLSRPSVRSTLNWIRHKAQKEPFIFD